jgi:FkbM family methyltransferase
MYCVRENGYNTDAKEFQILQFKSSKEKGTMFFAPSEGCAYYFYNMGFPERHTIYWVLENFIREDKNFVDIGAHIGSYSLVCGQKAKHTYAFECTPKTFCYLTASVALNRLENKVSCFPFALGEKESIAQHIIRGDDGGGNGLHVIEEKDAERQKVDVYMKTLDSFQLNNISCIKIDVEGYEKQVLEGSLETLRRSNYPPLFFESWNGDQDTLGSELFSFIKSLGYKIQKIQNAQDMFLATHPAFQ